MSIRSIAPSRIILWILAALAASILIMLGVVSVMLSTEAGSRWSLSVISDRLNQMPGIQVDLSDASGTLLWGMALENVTFSNATTNVEIQSLQANWNPYSILSRSFYLSDISADNISVTLAEPEIPAEEPQEDGPFALNFQPLPVDIVVSDLALSNISIRRGEASFALDNLSLSASLRQLQLRIDELMIAGEDLDLTGDIMLELNGTLPFESSLQWHYARQLMPGIASLSGELTAQGDLENLQVFHRLREPYNVHSSGSIATGINNGNFEFDLEHVTDSLILPYEQAADYEFEDVTLKSRGDLDAITLLLDTRIDNDIALVTDARVEAIYQNTRLVIDHYQLATASGQVNGNGNLDWSGPFHGAVTFSISDTDPLDYLPAEIPVNLNNLDSSGEVTFGIREGVWSTDVNLDSVQAEMENYPVSGKGAIGFREGTLHLSGVRLATADNEILVDGAWGNSVDLQWEIDAPVLNQLYPGLAGNLSGSGNLQGNTEKPDISGQLIGNSISYDAFSVGSFQASLSLAENRIDVKLDTNDIGIGMDTARQNIPFVNLAINGVESRHVIEVTGDTGYGQVTMNLEGSLDRRDDPQWQGQLISSQYESPIGTWQTRNRAELLIAAEELTLDNSCWIQQSASVCVDVNRDNASTRVHIDLQSYPLSVFNHPENQQDGQTPAAETLSRLPANVAVEGFAGGTLDVALVPGSPMVLDLDLSGENAALVITPAVDTEDPEAAELLDRQQRYQLTRFTVTGHSEADHWNFDAALGIASASIGNTALTLNGLIESRVEIDANRNLNGNVRAGLEDIGWVEALVPVVSEVRGELDGNLTVGGTLQEPHLSGNARIRDGQLSHDRLGITLNAITLDVSTQSSESIDISASARSGDGEVIVSGNIDNPVSADRSLHLDISGENFQTVNQTDFQLSLSPALAISANSEAIDVTGDVTIPLLNLNLVQLPDTAVDVSRDAVVVSYPVDQPRLSRSIASEQNTVFDVPVLANVNIILGNDIAVSGFGMEATLAGRLNIQQRRNGTNLTYGELSVIDGRYETYGQSLELQQGKLLFFGAYDNPALDIRAVREADDVTVGVVMNGTLKDINSHLFSTPELPESDIIAILVTGRPFSDVGAQDNDAMVAAIANLGLERSQGLTNQVRDRLGLDSLGIENTGSINNTTLTIGKYLTPDIFVRYGVGLFDNQSKLAIDYIVSDHVKLQAETGEYQSVDVTYRLER